MRAKCITSIIRKDTLMAMRNNLVLLALIAGILFSLIYYVLPSDVEETYDLAFYDAGQSEYLSKLEALGAGGLDMRGFESLEALKEAVDGGDYVAGIALPRDFDIDLESGSVPTITLYFKYELPESVIMSLQNVLTSGFEYLALGTAPALFEYEMLGEDMAGRQVPLRDLSLPLYIIMALLMEMWTISTLIVEESALGTLKAVLVTPATPSDVITAKAVVGVVYTLIVVSCILLLTQSLRGDMPALLLCTLLGAIFSVALGLFLGSLTNNITGSYIYVSVPLLILIIPALVIFFPNASLSFVKIIPTYYLAGAFNGVLNLGHGLSDVVRPMLVIASCDVALFVLGVFSLRRRYS